MDRPHILVQSVRTKFAQARASQQVAAARREAAKLAGARAFVQKAQVAQNRVVGNCGICDIIKKSLIAQNKS